MRNIEILEQENSKLTTKEQVRNYLGIDNYDYDEMLDQLILSASDFFRNETGYIWNKSKVKETLDGQGRNTIILTQKPVQTIENITINDGNYSNYKVYHNSGLIKSTSGVFISGMLNIEVVYTCGYDSLPADIMQACTEIVGQYFQAKDYQGIQQYTIGDESVTFKDMPLPINAQKALDTYHKFRL